MGRISRSFGTLLIFSAMSILMLVGLFLFTPGTSSKAAGGQTAGSDQPLLTATPTCGPEPWVQKAGYPLRVYLASVASDGTSVYANGGYDGTYHNETYRFDPAANTWTQRMPSP